MSKVLTEEGLEYFWGGIKYYINNEANTAKLYSVADSVDQINNSNPAIGSMVYVVSEDKTFQYTPSGWKELRSSFENESESGSLLKIVKSVSELNEIDASYGMLCYVEDEEKTYQYTKKGWGTLKAYNEETIVTEENYFKSVKDLSERNGLTTRIGMMCFVEEDEKTYQYTKDGWKEFSGSGGGGFNQVPVLSYTDEFPEGKKISVNKGNNVIVTVRFESSTYGNCTIEVYKDNIKIKTITSPKGTISLDLGKITAEGTYKFRISGRDKLDIPADDLYFTVVCGGISLTSDFSVVSSSTIYEAGNDITVNYSTKCSDSSSVVKIKYTLTQENDIVVSDIVNTNSYVKTGNFTLNKIPAGKFILKLIAYTGISEDDTSEGTYVSAPITNDFIVLKPNGIDISSSFDLSNIDQYTNINIPFKMVKKNTTRLIMRGIITGTKLSGDSFEKKTLSEGISAQVNIQSYWFIGKLDPGNYEYELRAYTEDYKIESEPVRGSFTVKEGTLEKIDFVRDNCVAFFDANTMSNTNEVKDIWSNSIVSNPEYAIKLHNLNYNTNGWMQVDDNDVNSEHFLRLNGECWGELIDKTVSADEKGQYKNIKPFEGFNLATEGLAIEALFRTRCVGELNYRALTCQNGINLNSPGVSISHDNLYISSANKSSNLGFSENEWTHVVFVVDRKIRKFEKDAGDTDEAVSLASIEDMNPVNTMRIYINGVLCSCAAVITDTFVTSLNEAFPLLLNTAINERGEKDYFGECEFKFIRLYNNYLTSTQVLQNYISSKYTVEEQLELYEKNQLDKNKTLPIVTFKKKKTSQAVNSKVNYTDFKFLNSITEKAVSKKSCIDCVAEIKYPDGNIVTLDNTEVYLQGTSSLQYPIKNYKIKLFKDNKHENKEKINLQGYDEWEPEDTFTLKCDYMESSHLNNTPLADLYDKIIDKLGGKSPAKFYNEINEGKHMRDAIAGFPCIVYYTDDPEKEEELTLVGSYMFNIDKSGNTLGFKVPVYKEDGNGSFLKDNPLTWNGNAILDENKAPVLDENNNPTYEKLTNLMQSYEGTANSPTYSAGCFYSFYDSLPYTYNNKVEQIYKNAYKIYKESTSDPVDYEDYKNSELAQQLEIPSYDEFKKDYNIYDYIADDFEPRYDYADKDGSMEKSYKAMADLVEGIANAEKTGTFKEYFTKHFDLTYALVYYLQMMVFAQVDNAGKNSMWDTWNPTTGKWYLRPYDMDTSIGLSNSGTETISVDAEILKDNSPYSSNVSEYSTNTEAELRYFMYNTQTSKVWNNFAKEFATEIENTYKKLRPEIYNMDYLIKHFTSFTTDKIPERIYNKDMAAKYLTQVDEKDQTYLKNLHGNRIQRFKQWMRQRLDFCDSLYNYSTTYTTDDNINSQITLRSDAFNTNKTATEACLGIETYTPQYVTVSVGSSRDHLITAYVGPESTFIDPYTGSKRKGTLFSFSVRGSDKEIMISGAGGIKNLHYLNDLDVRDLIIGNAAKIIELNIGGSTRMDTLSMGNNKYLRTLNLANSRKLGTGQGGNGLSLLGCTSLKKLDISNTQLTSVTFAKGSPLKEAVFTNAPIGGLLFENMEFLEKVDVTGCSKIDTYKFVGCSGIKNISIASGNIKNVILTDCTSLKKLDISYCNALEQLNITGCYNIEEVYCKGITGKVAEDLQLYTLYNLKRLDVNNSSVISIRLPIYDSKETASKVVDKLISEQDAPRYNKLDWLNASGSTLKYIQYGSDDTTDKCIDMSQLINLTYCNFYDCDNINRVKNIHYIGSDINSLFQQCENLYSVSGLLGCTGSTANNVFYGCYALSDIDNLSFKMDKVTNVGSFFSGCNLNLSALKKLFDACGTSLKETNSTFSGNSNCDSNVPGDLFENTPNITNIDYLFSRSAIQTLPENLFANLTKLDSARSTFYGCSNLFMVYTDIFSNNKELTTLESCFENCPSLTFDNAINTGFADIFKNNKKLKNLNRCFLGCSGLRVKNNDFGRFLDGLKLLTTTSFMFYQCYKLGGKLPNGLFKDCESLKSAYGMFSQCNGNDDIGITIPERLVRENVQDINTIPVTNLSGMFQNCSSLKGTIGEHFFDGMPKVTNVGYYYENSSDPELYGMFCGTGINKYHENMFYPLTELTNVKGFFKDCKDLSVCLYGTDNKECRNTVSKNIFFSNSKISDASYLFSGCVSAVGCIPADSSGYSLLRPCKKTITDVSHMFNGCTGLDGVDKDTDTYIGLPENLFKDCISLSNTSSFMNDCSNYNFTIPKGLFSGCTSLYDSSNMFSNCTSLKSRSLNAIPVSLFEDCRNSISFVNSMFYGCTELNGRMPEVIDGSDETKGLFEDCTSLINADNFFGRCTSITGRIPVDMFKTENTDKKYLGLSSISGLFYGCSGVTQTYHDDEDDVDYICNPTFLEKLPNLTNISSLFENTGLRNCLVPSRLFDRQASLENATNLFHNTSIIGDIPSDFLRKSLGSLTNASYMFSNTGINTVGSSFLRISTDIANNKLKYVAGIFANCSSTSGPAPALWDKNLYPKIDPDKSGYQSAFLNTHFTNVIDNDGNILISPEGWAKG